VYAIEDFPLSCASLGGTLVWDSWLMCCGCIFFEQYLFYLHIQVFYKLVTWLVIFACIICISCIFIVVSLNCNFVDS
jgi:hypothetical protein